MRRAQNATTAWNSGVDAQGRPGWTVLPHTGRPHQIRKYFARYLAPFWGDRICTRGVVEAF